MKLPTIDDSSPVGDLPPDQVQLRGTYIDTVVDVSEELSRMKDLLPLIRLLALVYKVRSPSPSEEYHMNTLMRTLSGDSLSTMTTEKFPEGFKRDQIIQSFSRFLSPVLNGLTGLGDFETAVGAGEDPASFRQFWALDDRNLLIDAISGSGPLAATTETEILFLDIFVKDKSRRLALTQDHGALALVPHDTRPGDEVWTMSRGDYLLVVRHDDEHEALSTDRGLLGEAYSHGSAKGKPPQTCKPVYNTEFLTSSVAVGLAGAVPK